MTEQTLPELPEPIANGSYTSCHHCQRYNAPIYSPEQMRAYAKQARAAALEEAALECRMVAQRQQTLGRQFAACDCESAIRAMAKQELAA